MIGTLRDRNKKEVNTIPFKKHILSFVFLLLWSVYSQAIYNSFGEQGRIANAVAWAESSMNPYAVSYIGCCVGLFQIHVVAHWNEIPGNTWDEKAAWLKNPYNNIAKAKEIWNYSGWGAWEGYTNFSYYKYL